MEVPGAANPAVDTKHWAFPVVWTTIHVTFIVSVGMAWNGASTGQQHFLLLLLGINMVLNMSRSALFFTLKRPSWALTEGLIF